MVVVVPRRPGSVTLLRSGAVLGAVATGQALQAVVPIIQEVQTVPFLAPAATEVVAPDEEVPTVLTGIGVPTPSPDSEKARRSKCIYLDPA